MIGWIFISITRLAKNEKLVDGSMTVLRFLTNHQRGTITNMEVRFTIGAARGLFIVQGRVVHSSISRLSTNPGLTLKKTIDTNPELAQIEL